MKSKLVKIDQKNYVAHSFNPYSLLQQWVCILRKHSPTG